MCGAINSVKGQIVNIDTVKTPLYYKSEHIKSAQNEYMYSIGLKAFSIQQMPRILKNVNYSDFYNSYFNGLLFKFNDNQISYRVLTDYITKNLSFNNECSDCEITTGKLTDYSLKAGFEKNITYSRIQPFFGSDIGFTRNKFKGESHNAGPANFTNPYDVITEKNGGVLTPFVGIKFNLTNQLTLSAESAFNLLYSYESQEKMYKDAGRTRTFQHYNKWEFLISPLNILSLQYNLGSVN